MEGWSNVLSRDERVAQAAPWLLVILKKMA
jgi:hypothetical protein